MKVQAEVSLYPLRTQDLGGVVELFCRRLSETAMELDVGPMSTRISGDAKEVFDALGDAFEQLATDNQIVLTMKVSNACPDAEDYT